MHFHDADSRARKLLKSVLGKKHYLYFVRNGCIMFNVLGYYHFEIRANHVFRETTIVAHGSSGDRFPLCVLTKERVHYLDKVAIYYLYLKNNPVKFLNTARPVSCPSSKWGKFLIHIEGQQGRLISSVVFKKAKDINAMRRLVKRLTIALLSLSSMTAVVAPAYLDSTISIGLAMSWAFISLIYPMYQILLFGDIEHGSQY